jgi:hypothetical protein
MDKDLIALETRLGDCRVSCFVQVSFGGLDTMCQKQISELLAVLDEIQDPDELRRLLSAITDCNGCPNHSDMAEPECIQHRLEFMNRLIHLISKKND